MTELNGPQVALLEEVERASIALKAERAVTEARIRELVTTEREGATGAARQRLTRALRAAVEAKVPKVRLKEVTTKDPRSFAELMSVTELLRMPAM